MRKRRFKTEADIARYVKEGFGQGEGSSYKPWIRVQDISSHGRSRKVPGIKSGRTHHVFSDLEYYYFLLLEFSEEVVDIREQFPLLATARARDIAAEMGVRYPMYVGTQVPFVLTSDFVVTVMDDTGKKRIAARTCKYVSELLDPAHGPRAIEKLDLERAIWADLGILDWKIATDQLMNPVFKDNLDWLHKAAWGGDEIASDDQQLKFAEAIVSAADGKRTLASIIRSISSAVGLPYRNGMHLFRSLVWNKSILADLGNARLDPTLPCPELIGGPVARTTSEIQEAA